MSSNPPPSQKAMPGDKPVPQPVRFVKSGTVFHRFTWKERIKILFGFSVLLEIHIASQHNPGICQPLTKFVLTPERDSQKAIMDHVAKVKAEQAQAVAESKRAEEAKSQP